MTSNLLNLDLFPVELFIAVIICTFHMSKRPYYIFRMIAAIIIEMLCMYVLDKAFREIWLGMPSFFIMLLIATVFEFFIFEMSMERALYYTLIGYVIQHFASSAYILAHVLILKNAPVTAWITPKSIALYLVIYVLSYFFLYFLFIRKLPKEENDIDRILDSAETFLLVVPIALVLSLIEKRIGSSDVQLAVCQIYAMIACFLVLWIQYWQKTVVGLKMEMALQNQVMTARRRQFDQSISNIDVINHKCHDLKYQIQALKSEDMSEIRKKAIDEVTEAVNFYDDFFQTGNEILDTVLMEKSIICRRYNVSFTAMIDGSKLGFMNPMDLYILMGNALDNAIEALREITDNSKRILNIRLQTKNDILVLQIENSHNRKIEFDENGNPVTSKKDKNYHGYGISSIRQIAEKYKGSISIKSMDDIFVLTIVFAR
ncbi:MAG: ATP-binding protein [Butyrivibrio sp.]|nr:ATP-binding protein [Butyrivibrio sp.]